jgi:hypothetical protein
VIIICLYLSFKSLLCFVSYSYLLSSMYLSLCFLEKLRLYILSFLFDSGEGVMVGYKIPCSFLLSDLFFCLLLEGTRQGAYIYI